MRAAQKVMVAAVVVVAFCAVAGAALAIPAHAQSLENPARPSNLAATSTLTTVTLIWDDPGDSTITGYKILSRITATESILTVLVSDTGRTGTSYTVSGLEPGTMYQFVVLAVNNAGNSVPSQIVTVSTRAQTAPPSDITALANIIESLTGIIESLSLKITALEAEIVDLRGTLSGRIVAPVTDSGDFVPVYYAATSQHNLIQKSHYEDRLFLENFTGRLTQTLALPYDVYLVMDECGGSGAVYDPYYKRIVVCYELVTFLEGRLAPYYNTDAELSRGVDGFVTWVMLHELGHALIDAYGLPVTGNEEDAVDQLATIIALEYIPSGQAGNVLYPALRAWSLGQNSIFPSEGELAGSHSLASQRFYNVACWMYGSDAHAFSSFVSDGLLTEARASQCQSGHERMSESWHRLVSQFLIEGDPVIGLNGDAEVRLNVGDTYTERGATCIDDRGGSLAAVRTSNAPNTGVAGTYTLEYSCTDVAGNTATATRTVVVTAPAVDNPPTINLGSRPLTENLDWNTPYTVPDLTCTDDKSSTTLTITLTAPGGQPAAANAGDSLNTRMSGDHAITYSCTDSVNPAVTVTITVTVGNPLPATLNVEVTADPWENSKFDVRIVASVSSSAQALDITDAILTSSHDPEYESTLNAVGGAIDNTRTIIDITMAGPVTFTVSANDGSLLGSDTITIDPILVLDDIYTTDGWDGELGTYTIPLGLSGSSGAIDTRLILSGGTDSIGDVTFDGNGVARVVLSAAGLDGTYGNVGFQLQTERDGNVATSTVRTANIPPLMELTNVEVGSWSGGSIPLTITGETSVSLDGNATANETDYTLALQVMKDDAWVTLGSSVSSETTSDLTAHSDSVITGTANIDDISLQGSTKFRLLATIDNDNADPILVSTSMSANIPVTLQLDPLSPINTNLAWTSGALTLNVAGQSVGLTNPTIDLQVWNGTHWIDAGTNNVANTGGVVDANDVNVNRIEISGTTATFRLATTADITIDGATTTVTAYSNEQQLAIPAALTLDSVTVDGDWTASALTLEVNGTSGLDAAPILQVQIYDGTGLTGGYIPADTTTTIGLDDGTHDSTFGNLTYQGLSPMFRLSSADGSTATAPMRVNIPAVLALGSVEPALSAEWTGDPVTYSLLVNADIGKLADAADVRLKVQDSDGSFETDVTGETVNTAALRDGIHIIPLGEDDYLSGSNTQAFRLDVVDSDGDVITSSNVYTTTNIPAPPSASSSSVDMVPTPTSFSTQNGFPPTTEAVINDISEIPAVHSADDAVVSDACNADEISGKLIVCDSASMINVMRHP